MFTNVTPQPHIELSPMFHIKFKFERKGPMETCKHEEKDSAPQHKDFQVFWTWVWLGAFILRKTKPWRTVFSFLASTGSELRFASRTTWSCKPTIQNSGSLLKRIDSWPTLLQVYQLVLLNSQKNILLN